MINSFNVKAVSSGPTHRQSFCKPDCIRDYLVSVPRESSDSNSSQFETVLLSTRAVCCGTAAKPDDCYFARMCLGSQSAPISGIVFIMSQNEEIVNECRI